VRLPAVPPFHREEGALFSMATNGTLTRFVLCCPERQDASGRVEGPGALLEAPNVEHGHRKTTGVVKTAWVLCFRLGRVQFPEQCNGLRPCSVVSAGRQRPRCSSGQAGKSRAHTAAQQPVAPPVLEKGQRVAAPSGVRAAARKGVSRVPVVLGRFPQQPSRVRAGIRSSLAAPLTESASQL
jgi:hypothetical protein